MWDIKFNSINNLRKTDKQDSATNIYVIGLYNLHFVLHSGLGLSTTAGYCLLHCRLQ